MRVKDDFVVDQITVDWGLGIELFINNAVESMPDFMREDMAVRLMGAQNYALYLTIVNARGRKPDYRDRGLEILTEFCKWRKKEGIQ